MSSNEDLERACLAAAQETREARAEVERLTRELARYTSLPADAVMVPSQAKVIAKIIRNDEEANEVIAVLRGSKCHADREAHHAECSTCQRTERAVAIVRHLAGLGAP